jgi:hypothetical protein
MLEAVGKGNCPSNFKISSDEQHKNIPLVMEVVTTTVQLSRW